MITILAKVQRILKRPDATIEEVRAAVEAHTTTDRVHYLTENYFLGPNDTIVRKDTHTTVRGATVHVGAGGSPVGRKRAVYILKHGNEPEGKNVNSPKFDDREEYIRHNYFYEPMTKQIIRKDNGKVLTGRIIHGGTKTGVVRGTAIRILRGDDA